MNPDNQRLNGGDLGDVATQAIQPQLRTSWCSSNPRAIKGLIVSASGVAAVVTEHGIISVLQNCTNNGGAIKHELVGQHAGVSSFVSSAKELIAGGADGFLKWWHLESGEEIASTQCPCSQDSDADNVVHNQKPSPVIALASSNVSHHVAAATGRFVSIFGSGGEHLHTLPRLEDNASSIAWVNNSLLAVASGTAIQTWSVTHDSFTHGMDLDAGRHGPIKVLACSSNGAYLAAASQHAVHVWDMKDKGVNGTAKKPLLTFIKSGEASCVSWDATNRYLAAAFGNELFVWDVSLRNGQEAGASEIVCLGHASSSSITSIAFQSSGPLLGAAANDGTVLVFNSQHFIGPGLVRYAALGHVRGVAERPCKSFLAWHASGAILVAYESGDMACFETIPDPTGIYQNALREHGERHMARGVDNSVRGRGARGGRAGFGRGDMNQVAPYEADTLTGSRGGMGGRAGRIPRGGPAGADSAGRFRGRDAQPAAGPSASYAGQQPLRQQQQQLQQPQPSAHHAGDAAQAVPGSSSFEGQQEGPAGMPWPAMPPHMQWPGMPPMQYMMFQPPQQAMAGAQPGMAAFPPMAPPPGRPGAPGSSLSTSVWSPSAGMTMPAGGQMPVYMYQPGQWPGMAYMPQWPGYGYGYYGYQPGAMPGMPVAMGMPGPMQMASSREGSRGGAAGSVGGLSDVAQSDGSSQAGNRQRPKPVRQQQQQPPPRMLGRQGSMEGGLTAGGITGISQPASGAFLPGHSEPDGSLGMPEPRGGDAARVQPLRAQPPLPQPQRPPLPVPGPGMIRPPRPGPPAGAPAGMQPAPALHDDSANNIYVGNLPPTVDEAMLFSHFIQFGFITGTQIIRDKETKESRGFGFVKYSHPTYAISAIQQMNGAVFGGPFGGHRIKVCPSRKAAWPKPMGQ